MPNDQWLSKLNGNPVDWLLDGNPWTRYRTLIDLLGCPGGDKKAKSSRKAVVEHPLVKRLVAEASDWMPRAASRNSDPQISYFTLRMLADLGLCATDKGIPEIVAKATDHRFDGLFACRGEKPKRPGYGEKFVTIDPHADSWHSSPCNSPMITYALLALGCRSKAIDASVERLKTLWETPVGWFCDIFFVNSQFSRVKAGCPMAGIMALEVFSQVPKLKESKYAKNGITPLQFHKDYGQTLYYFGRSKKFWTMKYPFVWYNGLYLAEVLSRFDFAKKSPLMKECIDWILASQDASGRFTATSIFMPYMEWDFGTTKEPSPWLTLLCCRILKRYFQNQVYTGPVV